MIYVTREMGPWDAPQVFRMTGDLVVTRYLGFRTHQTIADAEALIARLPASPGVWRAVCPIENQNRILGVVGVEFQGHSAAVVIYFDIQSKKDARGAGRAFSAPFVARLLRIPTVWRVWAFCHVDNIPPQRVMERMGAVREGTLRRFHVFPNISTEPQDCHLYSIVR